MIYYLRNRTFWKPSETQPLQDCCLTNSGKFRPLRDTKRFSTNRQPSISSSVLGLSCVRRPANISGFIVAVIVNAVKGMTCGWCLSNISKKVFKRLSPTITDNNSTASVTREPRHILVITSIPHVAPRLIFLGILHAMRLAVRLAFKATATLRSLRQRIRLANYFGTTITTTHPKSSRATLASIFQHDQSTITASSAIFEVDVRRNRIELSHDVNLHIRFARGQSRRVFPHSFRLASFYHFAKCLNMPANLCAA